MITKQQVDDSYKIEKTEPLKGKPCNCIITFHVDDSVATYKNIGDQWCDAFNEPGTGLSAVIEPIVAQKAKPAKKTPKKPKKKILINGDECFPRN